MPLKVKPAQAYACGVCGNLYRKDDHGKKSAEACCMCGNCGNMKERCGLGGYCKRCSLRKTISSNVQQLFELHRTIEDQVEQLARIEENYTGPGFWSEFDALVRRWKSADSSENPTPSMKKLPPSS
jgi:hypothetical protein